MRLADQYDWIVLGDNPGALLSASLVARLGLSVLVLPFGETFSARIAESGQLLDGESNILLGAGKAKQNLLNDIHSRIGLMGAESELLGKASSPQVITPKVRLALKAVEEDLDEEIRRELGKEADALHLSEALKLATGEFRKFWATHPARLTLPLATKKRQAAPKKGGMKSFEEVCRLLSKKAVFQSQLSRSWLAKDQKVSALAAKLKDKGLQEALVGLWYAVSGSPLEDPRLRDLLHLMALSEGMARFRGGLTGYRDLLAKAARRAGAEVRSSSRCKRIFLDRGRFQGIQLARDAHMISGEACVLGCSLSRVSEQVIGGERDGIRKLKSAPTPMGWKFTLSLTVSEAGIPPGALGRFVWKEEGAPALEVEIADATDYGLRPTDQKLVFARTVLPFAARSLETEYQRLIASRMMRQLSEILPFLEDHVIRISPDFREKGPKDGFAELYGFSSLERVPDNLRCYLPEQGAGARSGIDGLFIASDESFPGLGSLGWVVAALEAVAGMAHRSGLAGPWV